MADLLRIGKISSINYEKGTGRVTYEDRSGSTSAEFSFLAWEYWMPKIGEQVLTAHIPSETSRAVILGPVWHDGRRPVEGKEGLYRKEYENTQGEAYERYATDEKTLTIVAGGCTLKLAGGTITITGNLEVSGDAKINGNLTVVGNESVGGNQTVTGNSSVGGTSTVGSTITAGGDVTAGGISAKTHTHTGVHGETSGPH